MGVDSPKGEKLVGEWDYITIKIGRQPFSMRLNITVDMLAAAPVLTRVSDACFRQQTPCKDVTITCKLEKDPCINV